MRQTQRGFTFMETMMGMMVLLTAISFIAPAFTRDMLLNRMTWERRLAVKVIETQLDQACQSASTSAGFDALRDINPNPSAPAAITTPDELANMGATWRRTVTTDTPDLIRVQLEVNWTSSGRAMREPPATQAIPPYLISRVGLCGTGA